MIRGDAMVGIEAIGQLKAVLRRLSELPRRTAAEAKPGLDRLLRDEYRGGTDPYGNPWAPLRPATLAKGRRPPPLTDTGKMRAGTVVELMTGNRAGLVLKTGGPYSYFAQLGFRVGRSRVPPRRILPQFGLPVAWKQVLRDAARRAARKAVKS